MNRKAVSNRKTIQNALSLILCLLMIISLFAGCSKAQSSHDKTLSTTVPTEETPDVSDIEEGTVYHVGPTRKHTSLTKLFLALQHSTGKKTIYIDPGVYDIFQEYKDANIASPPDDVASSDYFNYNAFLPHNTNLIGIGNVRLEFAPSADEITYGESVTWAPLNVLGECHIENIEIYCKNGRYAIHDDSHDRYQNTLHYYKNVRCIYEYGDMKNGQQLGRNNTIGNGMAQGTTFEFVDCTFQFIGGQTNSVFYTHESGSTNPPNNPTLTFRNCTFLSNEANYRAIRLQNLATADLHIITTFENCKIQGGIYMQIYGTDAAQHFDVTLINSGNPQQTIDKPEENRYPIKVQ